MPENQIEISAATALAPLLQERYLLLGKHHAQALFARMREAIHHTIDARAIVQAQQADAPDYQRVGGSAALIPIIGILTRYQTPWDDFCGLCPGQRLLSQLAQAVADPEVKQIVLDIDCPGGMVSGTVEFADAIAAANSIKPIIAVIRGMCCSGGYWIASQCSQIISRRESEVGNIGVYSVLADVSKFYADMGVVLTAVTSGEFKGLGADGKVTETYIADTRRIITGLYQQFVAAFSAGRKIPLDAATAIADGKSYLGPQAKQLGLIDDIASSFDAAISTATGATAPSSEKSMSQANPASATAPTSAPGAQAAKGDSAAPAKSDVHDTLNATVTSANKHKDQARACLDACNTYQGEDGGMEDDTMDLAKQAVSALRASAEESSRAADAWDAKLKTDDQSEGEDGSDSDGSSADSDDGDGDESARGGNAGKAASAKELFAAFADDKVFAAEQCAAGATMAQAAAAYTKHVAKQVKDLQKQLAAASGQKPVGFNGLPAAQSQPQGTAANSPEEAEALAKKEWAANAGDCKNKYLNEKVYINARKRELARAE